MTRPRCHNARGTLAFTLYYTLGGALIESLASEKFGAPDAISRAVFNTSAIPAPEGSTIQLVSMLLNGYLIIISINLDLYLALRVPAACTPHRSDRASRDLDRHNNRRV